MRKRPNDRSPRRRRRSGDLLSKIERLIKGVLIPLILAAAALIAAWKGGSPAL
jgi:hypothetical protein